MNTFLTAMLLSATMAVSAQSALWTKGFGSSTCENMITDATGNSYITSYYANDPLEIDGIVIEPENTNSSWLGKFSPSGSLIWLVNMVASSYVITTDVQIDGDGNSVICGVSYGEAQFGTLTFGDDADIDARGFVAVFDPEGNCLRVGGTSGDVYVAFTDVTVSAAGDYFVSGQAAGEFYFGANIVEGYGDLDAVYGKFDADLDQKWMRSVGSIGSDAGVTITLDTEGNLLVAGYHEGAFLFDDTFFFGSYGGSELFLLKAQNDGDILWVRTLGSSEEEAQYWMSVVTDGENNVYLAANMLTEMNHSGGLADSYGGTDAFITAYDTDGFYQWFTHAGGAGNDYIMGMSKGGGDNLFIYGYFEGTAEVDGLVLNAVSAIDGFFAEFGLDGNAQWAWQTNGDSDEYVMVASVDPWQNLIVAGYASGNISVGGLEVDTPEDVDVSIWMAKLLTPDSEPETAVAEEIVSGALQVFPNPADTEIRFTLMQTSTLPEQFEIRTLQGQLVKTVSGIAVGMPVSVDDLEPGCYLHTPIYTSGMKGSAVQFVVVH